MYLSYGIPRAYRHLWKNWRAAINSIMIVASSLAVLGMIFLLYINVMHISEIWLSNTSVSLFLKKGITEDERRKVLEKVKIHPMVSKAKLVSPQEGLNSLAAKLGAEKSFLNGAEKNGVPFTIDFEVHLDYRKRIGDIAENFRKMKGVEDVIYAERMLEQVALFFNLTRGVGLFFSGLVLITFCLIIANSTRLSLHSRHQEIEILHLAGATRSFIRSAFIVEGMLITIVGWAIALAIIWFSFKLVIAGLTWNEITMSLKEIAVFFSPIMLAASLLVIIILGGISSHFSVNRLLREMEP